MLNYDQVILTDHGNVCQDVHVSRWHTNDLKRDVVKTMAHDDIIILIIRNLTHMESPLHKHSNGSSYNLLHCSFILVECMTIHKNYFVKEANLNVGSFLSIFIARNTSFANGSKRWWV